MNKIKLLLGLGAGTVVGWLLYQQTWVLRRLARTDARRTLSDHKNEAPKGLIFSQSRETDTYTVQHTVQDGIERIVYRPKVRRFETPIVMQHGMWHGAWCWQLWQELFAEWGWETHAHSLPGHGRSPPQRPIRLCTLDYYLGFLAAEVERMPRPPVLIGHSMGGALVQWYIKYVNDALPAYVLVAPWVSHCAFRDGLLRFLRLDPLGCLLASLDWSATPFVRNPYRAARALISERAVYSPAELHARLGPESAMILYQHNPPFWSPADRANGPMLWLAGEKDAVIGERAQRRSAEHYKADYLLAEGAGHNLMMEYNYRQTARLIHDWLSQRVEREHK